MRIINCNICGQNNTEVLFKSRDKRTNTKDETLFSVVRCKNCGLVYVNPQPSYEELKEFYGENYFGIQNSNISGRGRFFKFLQLIKNKTLGSNSLPNSKFYRYKNKIFQQTSGNFLDVGCATGVQNISLMKEFSQWKFYGVEPDEVAFRKAAKIENFLVQRGFLENAYYPNKFFDIILIHQTLEHTPDPKKILAECRRILKDDGRLIIAVPNFESLSSKIFGRFWYHLDIPRHLFHFSPQTMSNLLDETHFKIIISETESLEGAVLLSLFYLFRINPNMASNNALSAMFTYLTFPINKLFEKLKMVSGLYILASKNVQFQLL